MRRILALTVLVAACVVPAARAQTDAAIGLGLTASSYDPPGQLGVGAIGVGPLLRIKLGTGIGPAIGFNWYTVGVRTPAGTTPVYIGRIRVRPVMVGASYNWNRGRFWLSPSLVAGYAFTKIKINDEARPALRSSLGASFLSFESSNGFVWRPQFAVWYDAAPRVGLTASFAYIGVRPTLTIETDVGARKFPLDAACTVLTFGVVYGVF